MLTKLPLRPIWRDTPVLAAVMLLLLVFTAMRFVGIFGPAAWRVLLPLSFALMAAAPFVLLGCEGRRQLDTSGMGQLRLHLLFTLPALLFSPIGEELFFRGLMQRGLQERMRRGSATAVESAVFGLVHLGHHGLFINAAGAWGLLAGSGLLWVLLMAGVAAVFAWLRLRSDSVLPAVAAHAAFSAAMNAYIFGVLWA
jgi:uncharacterized protein